MHKETAYYLYCLSPSDAMAQFNESGVFVCPCGGISAVLSEVSREEFCGDDAEARLQDLAWVAPRACRHEAVVERVMKQAPVLPARFATLFSSVDHLQKFVLDHHDTIAGFLASFTGQREWAVKVMLDRRLADAARAGNATANRAPGTDYLKRRRADACAREDFIQYLRSMCEAAARTLRQCTNDFRERKVWKAGEAEGQAETILNWAFLVPVVAEAEFMELLGKLNEEHSGSGLSLALSGPWPPYSFAPALERK